MLGKISQKILNRVTNKGTPSHLPLITVLHDRLMAEYGWIPFHEFKDLPAETVYNLLDAAVDRHKREESNANKGRKGRTPMRRPRRHK
jgi:hypothetical protein